MELKGTGGGCPWGRRSYQCSLGAHALPTGLLRLHWWLCHSLISHLLICDLIPNPRLDNHLRKG